ncbi:MAG: hypothetical protein A3J10_00620 [Candidatus Sungbacteria bacterium RIFCSPLOWO2_02_FULL_54_10]|uniref:Bis(5'-nucleosyl)-tetraphosphatase [asymmetrical] n=2 Tax=Candidatus Sungiibacteriota TaxID=1817917 RepID=A0A1G2LAA8_9BACT|nr:MAG: hypothetical protein A2679_03060 [Candidatus Sungbacteria bacterium RIFCSPHIGHO2_01_FULL_54_26]OHA03091.1 MAG: hypothetical protein A3C92_02005 [Candidatus Sungbacteria bacterium RIFCSPHIGHO2_02_FULL_53_17]OHA07719.1 MAG: hypothetical protein A3B34_00585 [Candidatus Sungbacteria bacterium RIFCSPLOWO2_01_FULL_54_21]OHA12186.1 MAG: hypothetical protein A3J10_00620 [Candidatus Sungbacteria bacterium RIFCSPLOWO2_02_FULL_54_10]
MPVLRSAGFVVFRDTPEGRRYLLLRASRKESLVAAGKTVKEFWDFPKGELEKGETGIDAARRETREEAGIGYLEVIEGFKATARYFSQKDGKPALKFVAMFLGRAGDLDLTLSWEHDRYEWLAYGVARERITLPQMKEVLEKAGRFLEEQNSI